MSHPNLKPAVLLLALFAVAGLGALNLSWGISVGNAAAPPSPPAAAKQEAKPKETTSVARYPLKYAPTDKVDQTLNEVLKLIKEKDIRTVQDPRTNSILVIGSKEQLRLVEALVRRLDQLQGRVKKAEEQVEEARERVAYTQRLVVKGFASVQQLELDKQRLKAAELALEQARKDLE